MRSRRLPPSDKISNLPDSLIESILLYLPTQDAVRTSILSTRWRYAWTRLPQLIIGPIRLKRKARTVLSRILCQFALLHQGPIKKFALLHQEPIKKFCISEFKWDCPELEDLFSLLSKKGVEDISLIMRHFYKLPPPLFACKQLKQLNLQSCKIDTTVEDFSGFSSLISLRLHSVIICGPLESFISNCPLLEQLCLDNIHCVPRIEIDAPMLKSFISVGLEVITFRNTPLLSSVSLYCCCSRFNLDTLVDLPVLHKLHIERARKDVNVPVNPRSSVLLKDVSLSSFTLDVLELSSLLWLIKSSPKLKHMSIQFAFVNESTANDVLRFLKEQDSLHIMLDELEEIILKRVHGIGSELEFIKFLLAKSPRLKKIIVDDTLEGVRKILEKYLKVPIETESKKSIKFPIRAHTNLGW